VGREGCGGIERVRYSECVVTSGCGSVRELECAPPDSIAVPLAYTARRHSFERVIKWQLQEGGSLGGRDSERARACKEAGHSVREWP
jgi:hypothetical protein